MKNLSQISKKRIYLNLIFNKLKVRSQTLQNNISNKIKDNKIKKMIGIQIVKLDKMEKISNQIEFILKTVINFKKTANRIINF